MSLSNSNRVPVLGALAFGVALFLFAFATPAGAGSYGGGGGCNTGCKPPPTNCGTCGGGGHHGGKGGNYNSNKNYNYNFNKNYNNNTNTNTNTNTNINENNINIQVNANASASATATAIANANAAADSASQSMGRDSAVGIGNGSGGGFGGGGSSYFVSAPQAAPMGALNVIVRTARVVKPVKAICVSAKGLEEAARMSSNVAEVNPTDDVELFHCTAGDMLVATIGRMAGKGDGATPDYIGGYVIECRPGEALRHGSNGMLACLPQQKYGQSSAPAAQGKSYAEVLIRKNERGEEVAATGGAFFSGGVGY